MSSRLEKIAVAALLAAFLALVWTAAAHKCETMDEGLFVAGGAAQVAFAEPNIDLTHPPLLRWLAGMPALLAGAVVPEPIPEVPRDAMDLYAYKVQEAFDYGQRMLESSGHDHDRVLGWARTPFALLGALCGLLLWREARRLGARIALCALATFLFLPEVLAHSGWAHSDVASMLATLVVALALARAVEIGGLGEYLGLGLALGFAAAVKLTGLLLWPVAVVVLLVLGGGMRRTARGAATAVAVGWFVLVFAYLPQPRLLGHEFLPADLQRLGLSSWRGVLDWLPVPDTFLKGVIHTLLLGQRGQPAFFHGAVSTHGWRSYFPIAIFLKYPTGLLLVAVPGLWALWRSAQLSRGRKAALTFTPLCVLAAAMSQSVDIGVRSVLPLAPFFALWCAEALAVVAAARWRRAAWVLVASSILSGATAYPDFLAYFNPLLGGTRAAGRWLVDSNLDWGQDLPALRREIEKRHIEKLRLAYFGAAIPARHGVEAADAREIGEGWYAVSRTFLSGVWPPGDPYGWLRSLRPVALVGGSIALFQVREADVAAAWRAGGRIEVGMSLGLLRRGRDPAGAAAAFAEVLARRPGHYGALYQRAGALDAAGRGGEALAAWRAFLAAAEAASDDENAARARARIVELGK